MQFILVVVAISFIALGVFTGRGARTTSSDAVLSATVEEPSVTATPAPTDTVIPVPTKQGLKPTSIKATEGVSDNSSLELWIYPESSVTVRGDSKIAATSTDEPATITTWYKNKIKELQVSATSVVQTNTNNLIHNVVAASGNGQSVHVDIKKNQSEQSVTIVITRE